MDDCIRTGVSTSEKTLPGRLGLHRRAPMLYRRLMRGFYPALSPTFQGYQRISEGRVAGGIESPDGFDDEPLGGNEVGTNEGPTKRESPVGRPAARVVGQFDHPLLPVPPVRDAVSTPLLCRLTASEHRGRQRYPLLTSYRVMRCMSNPPLFWSGESCISYPRKCCERSECSRWSNCDQPHQWCSRSVATGNLASCPP